MHTTALVVKVGEHTAILYYSSRRHAGENLQGLLDKREAGLDKPLAMSDALASNEVANAAALIRCHCLAHGPDHYPHRFSTRLATRQPSTSNVKSRKPRHKVRTPGIPSL